MLNRVIHLVSLLALAATAGAAGGRERHAQTAQVAVQTGQAGCGVDLDADATRPADAGGHLLIAEVDPGDHYVHVRCPGKPEAAYFISPRAGEVARISLATDAPAPSAARDPTAMAAEQAQLRQLVLEAVQLRAQARLDEAVNALRQAAKLDPENSDLHRELGITFLLAKEWKRARVEMIEALRHDQADADAHNGLGYALEKLGDMEGALREYRTATHLEPDDPTYRTHYFEALAKIQTQQETKK